MAIDLKNLPPAVRIILIFLPIVIIVPVFYFAVYSSRVQTAAKLDKDITALNNDINVSNIKASKLEELRKENLMLQARLKELKEQLPDEKEVSSLLKEISDLGSKSGLNILYWKPGERKANPSGLYEDIPMKVEASGGYHDLGIFFSHISNLKRIVNISGIKMSDPKIDRGSVIIKTSFTATTFAATEGVKKEEPSKKGTIGPKKP